MGDPRRLKRKYKKPGHPFEKERILEELQFVGKYGLRNKREFWKSRSALGKFRDLARKSRRLPKEQAVKVQQTLIDKLKSLGLLGSEAQFEDILLLTVEDLLKRRLQTIVLEKGFAKTIYDARQKIVHGHIQVKDQKVNAPSYIVKKDEERLISFHPNSPFATTAKTQ